MKIAIQALLLFLGLFLHVEAATTSWKGITSTNWSTASNWTSGVPTATVDVIIGDASFTGAFQPVLTAGTSTCKSLTIGNAVKVSSLSFINNKKNLTVLGDVLIGANGTIAQTNRSTFKISGNWNNLGTYTTGNVNSAVIMAGAVQSITGLTVFRRLTINAGSTTTINSPISATALFSVSGTVDPGTNLITLTGATFSTQSGGYLKVRTATFAGNYSVNPTLNSSSTVDYASTSLNQSVSAFTYGTLVISGGTTKTAVAGFTLQSSSSGVGNIQVTTASTFDISSFTVNRGATGGGAFVVANGCTFRLAGAFPLNFSSYSIGPTSLTEYYGGTQTINQVIYGNLLLSSSSGTVTKTFASSAITILGYFTTSVSAGSMIVNTAAMLTVNGNVTIGASSTFNGLTFSHVFAGSSFANSGTITSSTGTLSFTGINATLSGAGTYNINNLTFTRGGATAAAATNLTLTGNLTTISPGTFTHTAGSTGAITMSGASKTITGLFIVLNHLTVSGTISTIENISIAGNITVNGASTFTATAGVISFTGASKSITNSGTLTFYKLDISAGSSITTASNFFIKSDLSTTGTITASAGIVTFNGTSTVSGLPNLFSVTLNGVQLTLSNNSVLGIAGTFTLTAGTFNVTTSTPNTVNYNGSGAQSVLGTTYNRLSFSTGGTKTASGAITTNDYLTINTGATFAGSTFTHSIYGDWFNYGAFTASASTVQFIGAQDSYITGATTFSILTLNKSNAAYTLRLNNNISVGTVNMTTGELRTGSNAITITTTRTGNGIILGIITRTHAFNTGTFYAFESPANTVNFSIINTISSITMTVTLGTVNDYPYVSSINREYSCAVTAVGGYAATLRLHYLDAELEGNDETTMVLWNNSGSWASSGKSANDATANWVEKSGLTSLTGRWTMSGGQNVVQWTGAVGTSWTTAGNWQIVQGAATAPPGANDIVLIGSVAHVNQPSISTSISLRALRFYSTTASTLTLSSGGSLAVGGSLLGSWTGNAAHTIVVGAQVMTVGGNLTLSNGTANQIINLAFSSGSVSIGRELIQSGGASITASGSGGISLMGDYTYTSGSFVPSTSTFTYNGISTQVLAPVPYYNLTINKASGTAVVSSATTVSGNLITSTGGQLDVSANMTVGGNVTIGASTIVNVSSTQSLSVGGNWTRAGTFVQGAGTVTFNGTTDQNIGATNFNQLVFNKASGIAYVVGNVYVNEDVAIQNCAVDIAANDFSRTVLGGTLILTVNATLKIGGASNFPANFSSQSMSSTSTVEFNGAVIQNVPDLAYGNLVFTNGGTNAKTILTQVSVANDLTINSGATLDGNGKTIILSGNWINNGTYTASFGTLRLLGASKTLSGNNNFYNITCLGSYSTVSGTTTNVLGLFINNGNFTQASNIVNFFGSLVNNGTLTLNGTTNVMGLASQTLANNGTFVSGLSGIVNYNGTVSTLIFSTAAPQYATVNINNTAGITSIQPWTVLVAMNIGSGALFDGGGLTHSIRGNFINSGTVVNNGGGFTFSPLFGPATINFGSSFSATGTVTFAGSLAITIAGSGLPTFGSVVMTNTNVAGITATSDWNVINGITIGSGSFFHAGAAHMITLGEDITVNGDFDGGTSTVVMNGVGDITGTGNVVFNNLTLASINSAFTDFDVTGNFIDNGTFDPIDYTVTFSGSSVSSISGTAIPVPFNNLFISKTGSTVTLLNDIYAFQDINIQSGTLLGATKTISLEGDWTNDGTFNEIPPTSTVNFLGIATQNIGGTSNTGFGHVVVNNSTGISLLSAHTINGSLTLTSGIITSSGLLTVNLNQGSIAGTGTGNITGNINVTKSLFAQKFHYVASPLIGMTLNDWNDNIAANAGYYYWYDETLLSPNFKIGWTNTTNVSQALTPLQGFIVYNRWPKNILDMTGNYNHPANPSNISLTLSRTGNNGADGWNLVGNPFPSPLDWNAAGWTRTGVYSAIYFWDPANSRYSSYVSGAGINGGTQYIPAMQAYFVRLDTTGVTNKTANFGLNSTPRVTSTSAATPTLWRTGEMANMLKLTLQSSVNSATDETIVRFLDGATDDFDGDMDAYKLLNDPSVPSFYSSYRNNIYAVNSIPLPQKNTVIPLSLKVPASGNYSISSEQLAAFDPDISIVLVDTIEHTRTDLKTDQVYYFDYDKASQDGSMRFFLNFDNTALTVTGTTGPAANEGVSAKYYNSTLYVYFPAIASKSNHISIVDMGGHEVFVADNVAFSSGVYEKQLKGLVSGLYIVNVSSGEQVSSSKIFIDK